MRIRIAGVLAETQNEHLPNTNIEHYCYITLLGYKNLVILLDKHNESIIYCVLLLTISERQH